ncbi:hypothetical protein KBD61_02970 [Patescibacteria group bacterium]|nr:hypothetical protein [Patescibacteria group bacterium]
MSGEELVASIEALRELVRPKLSKLALDAPQLGINEENEESMGAPLENEDGQTLNAEALQQILDELKALDESCEWHQKAIRESDELLTQIAS